MTPTSRSGTLSKGTAAAATEMGGKCEVPPVGCDPTIDDWRLTTGDCEAKAVGGGSADAGPGQEVIGRPGCGSRRSGRSLVVGTRPAGSMDRSGPVARFSTFGFGP